MKRDRLNLEENDSLTKTNVETKVDSNLTELIFLLLSVDTSSKEAKLNEVSMSDNNGGRIFF